MLIPLCNPSAHDPGAEIPPTLPQLRDNGTEEGNLRYWVITNRSMWAGQDRMIDEIFDVFDGLYHFLRLITLNHPHFQGVTLAQDAAAWYMARIFKQRAILPPSPEHTLNEIVDQRERELFRTWVFKDDRKRQLDDERYVSERDSYPSTLPEKLFWQDGDEGEWNQLDIPQWKDMDTT